MAGDEEDARLTGTWMGGERASDYQVIVLTISLGNGWWDLLGSRPSGSGRPAYLKSDAKLPEHVVWAYAVG